MWNRGTVKRFDDTSVAPVATWTSRATSAATVQPKTHRPRRRGTRQAARAIRPARALPTMAIQAQSAWKRWRALIRRLQSYCSGSRRACRGDTPRPPGRALLLDDVEGPQLAGRAHRALGRMRLVAVLEGGAVDPVVEGLLRAPPGVDEADVAPVARAQQLELLEAGHLRDLTGPVGEALLELLHPLRRDRDGIDADDAHERPPVSRVGILRSTSGSRNIRRAWGTPARTAASARSMTNAVSERGMAPSTAILATTRRSSGPRCSVRRWMTRSTPGVPSRAAQMAACTAGAAASPMRRLLVSTASTKAMQPSRAPMARLPTASKRGFPVSSARPMPTRAKARPSSAPVSSRRTTGSSGTLAWRMNSGHRRSPFSSRLSRTAVRSEEVSRAKATTSVPTAQGHESSSWGWRIFSTPSMTAKRPPAVKRTTATTKLQKYRSRPYPKGWAPVAGLRARRPPM